jgi:hypothetical protein
MSNQFSVWAAWGKHEEADSPGMRESASPVVLTFETGEGALDATGGLRQSCHLTGAFARSGGEEFINVFQFETSYLREDPDHGSNAVLLVVILEHVDDFPMLVVELRDALGVLDVLHPLLIPLIQIFQKTVFIYRKGFTFEFHGCHAEISSFNILIAGFLVFKRMSL